MKQAFILAVALTAALSVPMVATATHESSDCSPTASEADVEAEGYAVFVDDHVLPDDVSVWIYQESNGLDGIQRGDSVATDEACGHGADTIIL